MRVKYFIGTGEELAQEVASKNQMPFKMEIFKTEIAEEALLVVKAEEKEILQLKIYDIDFIKHPILADLEEELDEIFANLNFYIGIIEGKRLVENQAIMEEACNYALEVLLEEFNGLVMEEVLVRELFLQSCFKEANLFKHNRRDYYHFRNMKEDF